MAQVGFAFPIFLIENKSNNFWLWVHAPELLAHNSKKSQTKIRSLSENREEKKPNFAVSNSSRLEKVV